jgi:hypothetical protein
MSTPGAATEIYFPRLAAVNSLSSTSVAVTAITKGMAPGKSGGDIGLALPTIRELMSRGRPSNSTNPVRLAHIEVPHPIYADVDSVMSAAEWDRKLIADLAAERTGLGKSEVVGVRRLAAAHETCLLGDIAQVLAVAIAPRGSDSEHALINALRLTLVGGFGGGDHLRPFDLRHRRIMVRGCSLG